MATEQNNKQIPVKTAIIIIVSIVTLMTLIMAGITVMIIKYNNSSKTGQTQGLDQNSTVLAADESRSSTEISSSQGGQEEINNQEEATGAKLQANQLVIVETARIAIQDDTYKSLYPDMLQAIIKNTANETIKDMEIGFLGYDKNGYPVKIKNKFNYSGGSYEFVGSAQGVNVIGGATFGEGVGWELDNPHGISKVLANVKSATFYDGTTWINPDYNQWIEKYKEKPLNN